MTRDDRNTAKTVVFTAVVSALVGYVAGILTAPRSGQETREDITNRVYDIKSDVEAKIEQLHEDIEDLVDEAKDRAQDMKDRAKTKLMDVVDEAKESKRKVISVAKAFRNGEADDRDLDRAIKNAKTAKNKLADFLKK